MVKLLKMDPKLITEFTLNVCPKIVSLALGHEVVDFGCFTPIKLMIGWQCLESRTRSDWFWVHTCVGKTWHAFFHLLTATY